jgi:hypothetical protein
MKSAPTIAFDYAPSRAVVLAGALVCAGAALAPWLSVLPVAACAGVSSAAAGFGAFALHSQWRTPFRRIACRASGWTLVDLADTEHEAILESHAQLGALMVLAFRHGPRARFRAVLGPDNLDAETRRRLVLLLARAEIAHAR